jgi:hypothetical protein
MRRALFAGLLLTALPAAASAQSAPYLGTIADSEVLVRSGPSDKFPETSTLKRGAPVIVDHEEFGWLAIEAPKGSVSWVPIAFLEFDASRPTPQNAMVTDDVTLASGKDGLEQPLTEIRKTKVPAGSILKVIGQKTTFDGKQWYPVEPVYGDFRYVPKSAVKAGEPASTAFVVRDATPPGFTPAGATSPKPAAVEPPATGKPGVNHPLWAQAEAAERDGRPDEAEKFYFQLARLMNEPGGDHDVANLCYTRIHAIREKKRSSNAASPATATKPELARPTLLPPVRNEVPVNTSTTPDKTGEKGAWTGVGRLVVSPLALDGRQTYALETAPGISQIYVVGDGKIDLSRYRNKKVNVFGSTHTHVNASKPYVIATDVREEQ